MTRAVRLAKFIELYAPAPESLAHFPDLLAPCQYLYMQQRGGFTYFTDWIHLDKLAAFATEGGWEGWLPHRVIDLDTGLDIDFRPDILLVFDLPQALCA